MDRRKHAVRSGSGSRASPRRRPWLHYDDHRVAARSRTWRRLRRETGGSSYRHPTPSLIRWRPFNHGLSCFCCVCAGQERDVPECRQHRLAGKQADVGVFWEVCGHFYMAAGRWAANQRLAELKVGRVVLKICISCHIPQPSPVEAATSPDLGSILAGVHHTMPATLARVSL